MNHDDFYHPMFDHSPIVGNVETRHHWWRRDRYRWTCRCGERGPAEPAALAAQHANDHYRLAVPEDALKRHQTTIEEAQKMDTPDGLWRWICSCGRYGGVESLTAAKKSGIQHAKAVKGVFTS